MAARVLLTLLMSLSLLLPAGGGSAHAPGADGTAAAADATDADLAGQAGGCHPDGTRADPVGEPPAPAPAPSAPECCPTCDCECPCPIGKGMAIGPAHLALVGVHRATGPLPTGRGFATGAPPLRPPITGR